MSQKRPARSGNPDLRRATQLPGPPIAEIEAKLWNWLTPLSFKPSRLTRLGQKTARWRPAPQATAIDITSDDGGSFKFGVPQDFWFKRSGTSIRVRGIAVGRSI